MRKTCLSWPRTASVSSVEGTPRLFAHAVSPRVRFVEQTYAVCGSPRWLVFLLMIMFPPHTPTPQEPGQQVARLQPALGLPAPAMAPEVDRVRLGHPSVRRVPQLVGDDPQRVVGAGDPLAGVLDGDLDLGLAAASAAASMAAAGFLGAGERPDRRGVDAAGRVRITVAVNVDAAEALSARAIREDRNLEDVAAEIVEREVGR